MSEEQREYWSNVASQYDRVVDQQIGPGIRSLLRDRLATEHDLGHVVEFGCGTGFYTRTLASKAIDVVATDLAPGMLALAERSHGTERRLSQRGLPAHVVRRCGVRYCLHQPRAALRRRRYDTGRDAPHPKPGGRLIITNLDVLALRVSIACAA
jgi:SAM-dependent methyltransferase